MELRQIVRDQKLSNFDYKLVGFISEADEEIKYIDKDGKSQTMAVAPALRIKDPKHPARIAAEKLRGSEDEPDKKAAVDDEEAKVNIDDEKRDNINDFGEEIGLQPSDADPDVFVDEDDNALMIIGSDGELLPGEGIEDLSPTQEKQYKDRIDGFNAGHDPASQVSDFLDTEPDEDKPDKEPQKPETKPPAESASEESISKFQKSMYPSPGSKPPRLSGFSPRSAAMQRRGEFNPDNTPDGNPPSDASARQTSIDLGYPKSGETDRWETASDLTGRLPEPAPGNPGSMYNEVFSVEGCNIAEKWYEENGVPPTVDDLMRVIDAQFGDSQLAADNGAPDDDPRSEYQKKLRTTAEAALTKFDRLQNAMDDNADDFGEAIKPPSEFYGSQDSIEAQARMIRETKPPAKIYGPDGPIEEINVTPKAREEMKSAVMTLARNSDDEEWKALKNKEAVDAYVDDLLSDPSDPEKIKKFVEILARSGGGGANPSDTATFVRSEDGSLMVLFHSDKLARSDQQSNSTLAKETRQQKAYLEDFVGSGAISEDQKEEAERIFDDTQKELDEIKSKDETPTVARNMLKFKGKKREAALEAVRLLSKFRGKDNPMAKAGFKDKDADKYLKYLTEKGEAGEKLTADERKSINRVFSVLNGKPNQQQKLIGQTLEHDLTEDEMLTIDATTINATKTIAQIRALDQRRKKLDEISTGIKGPDGEQRGVGQVLEAQLVVDQLHLYGENDPSSLAYQSGMCATVIGTDIVDKETLRECLETDNTEELLGRLTTEAPKPAEEDFTDEATGVPNSMLQRSNTSIERDDNNNPYYFIVDENNNIIGKATKKQAEKEGLKILKTGKGTAGEDGVTVGVPTGVKKSTTFMDKEGNRFDVMQTAARSKAGPGEDMETVGSYGKQMQDCIGKDGKSSIHEESIDRKLSTIISETKQNTLSYHWAKAEEDYPVNQFIREINEGSLN